MDELKNVRNAVVFSGGSAANNLVDVFKDIVEVEGYRLAYVIPISDNGGSSSELIRVFGGPGIGDVRSRLVRLIPEVEDDPERHAIRAFFNYRLNADSEKARLEWLAIVEAHHSLWREISSPKKELIRSILNVLNLEIVKRARPSSVFNFRNASIGNMFLTGARLFIGSLESAIYLLSSICMIPNNVSVLPAINTNFSHHICAGLADGKTIAGQNSISHPSEHTAVPSVSSALPSTAPSTGPSTPAAKEHIEDPMSREIEHADTIEDANLPGSLPTLRRQYIVFSKAHNDENDLPARIERLWYINPYGQEIRPPANPKIIEAINAAQSIVFSIGSLYTSIVPCLILRGVGEAIAASKAVKILILNGSIDRETGPSSEPYTATDFVRAIAKAAIESAMKSSGKLLTGLELNKFVSHVIHLEGAGCPVVDKLELSKSGIECIRVYGRNDSSGSGSIYDHKALSQALQALMGKRGARSDLHRRNTLIS